MEPSIGRRLGRFHGWLLCPSIGRRLGRFHGWLLCPSNGRRLGRFHGWLLCRFHGWILGRANRLGPRGRPTIGAGTIDILAILYGLSLSLVLVLGFVYVLTACVIVIVAFWVEYVSRAAAAHGWDVESRSRESDADEAE